MFNVIPCDTNLVSAICYREFEGTADCPAFVEIPIAPLWDGTATAKGYGLSDYLQVAQRRSDPGWAQSLIDAANQVKASGTLPPLSLGIFVKDEPYVGKTRDDVKPRIIKNACAYYAAVFNPMAFSICEYWKSHCDPRYMPAFGLSRDQVGDWISMAIAAVDGPVAFVENDCSAWDSTVSVDALKYEARFYQAFTDAPPEFHKLMRKQFKQKCENSAKTVKFTRRGGRASGVGNTSLGNTILNLSMHRHSLGALANQCFIIAIGDDMLCVCPQALADSICTKFTTDLTRWGFKPTAKWTSTPEHAEFCSSYIASTVCGRLTLVPKTGKQVFKLLRSYFDCNAAFRSTVENTVVSSADPCLVRAFHQVAKALGWTNDAMTRRFLALDFDTTDDRPQAIVNNPYSLGGSTRTATTASFFERYGVTPHPGLWLGSVERGYDPVLDAVISMDVAEDLSGNETPTPVPMRVRKSPPKGDTPAYEVGLFFEHELYR